MRPITVFSLTALAFLAACAGPANPGRDPTGTWIGTLVTDQGRCPTDLTSTLRIRSDEVLFTPGDGSQVLRGVYHPGSQHYHAELVGQDPNHKPVTAVFNGYPVGQGIGGMFGSSECRAHITLTRR